MTMIDASYVRSILHYDPDTGVFTWKKRSDAQPNWNARFPGTMQGKSIYLGHYDTPDEAHLAYLEAKRSFHPFWRP